MTEPTEASAPLAPAQDSSTDELSSRIPERTGFRWKLAETVPSLAESHRSIPIFHNASVWRKLWAFAGPGYLVAVGYMDPGNWATDLGGGSKFGYTLLSVVLISSLMAVFLQALSAKLGIVTGRDLAQACRAHYSPPVRI